MAEQATPPESASPDKVVERLEARRDQLQKYITKFRFRWWHLIMAFVIGAGVNGAIGFGTGTLSAGNWHEGAVAGAVLYLFLLGIIQGSLRGDLMETNRLLAGTDINKKILPSSRRKSHGRRKPVSELTWNDNPFVIAVKSSAATVTLCATLVFTVILPTWDRVKDNQIATLKTEPTRLKNELDDASGQLQRMESANVKLRRDLDRLSPDSLFSLDDVYPRGFRSVRIGDRIDLLKEVYGLQGEIDDEGSWVSINLKNGQLFSSIAYYYDENARLKTVTSILFQFDNKDGRTFELLKQQLTDKYGFPKVKEGKGRWHKTELVWSGVNKHIISLADGMYDISKEP